MPDYSICQSYTPQAQFFRMLRTLVAKCGRLSAYTRVLMHDKYARFLQRNAASQAKPAKCKHFIFSLRRAIRDEYTSSQMTDLISNYTQL